MSTKTLSWSQLLKEEEQNKKNFEEMRETKFIPIAGESHKIQIISREVEPCKIVSKGGDSYDGYRIKVKEAGKEKNWDVFRNTALAVAKALTNHPDGYVTVAQAKGSKDIVVT